MKQFELQTPISQLFNALKSQYFACELFQIGCSEQLNKTHNFRKIILVTSSLELYWTSPYVIRPSLTNSVPNVNMSFINYKTHVFISCFFSLLLKHTRVFYYVQYMYHKYQPFDRKQLHVSFIAAGQCWPIIDVTLSWHIFLR